MFDQSASIKHNGGQSIFGTLFCHFCAWTG